MICRPLINTPFMAHILLFSICLTAPLLLVEKIDHTLRKKTVYLYRYVSSSIRMNRLDWIHTFFTNGRSIWSVVPHACALAALGGRFKYFGATQQRRAQANQFNLPSTYRREAVSRRRRIVPTGHDQLQIHWIN
mmetsp:Transcript_20159/g.21596  ORF Transcript_20159/g.21596 Transcript_20159/m.21596 type:complete len:134 (-) Transcript_20159:192-593(-)